MVDGRDLAVLLGSEAREVGGGYLVVDEDLKRLAGGELGQGLQRQDHGTGAGEVSGIDLHAITPICLGAGAVGRRPRAPRARSVIL